MQVRIYPRKVSEALGEETFSGGTVLLQTCRRGPRPSFSSFPRAFVLTESLSPLAQAVFGMTTLQRYNAPKISLAASFSFLKTDRLVQALFTPPVVLKPCFLFPAFSPCRQTKKEGLARPFVHTTVPPPRSFPTGRLGKEREGIGDGKGNPISGFLFPSQNMIFSQFRATAAGSVPSCWRMLKK